MNQSLSEIAFVLDRSGSMESIREATINGFNAFLETQQQAPGLVRLTLNQFDDEQLIVHDAVPVAEILPLNLDTYVPRASTALLDAIGDTIDRLGQRLAAMPENNRPVDVTVAILTDGMENASRRFTWNQVSDRIKHQTEAYGWDFLFLGADADTIATAGRLSIHHDSAVRYSSNPESVSSLYAGVGRKVSSKRAMKMGIASAEEQADSMAPMAQLLAEEEELLRRKQQSGE